MEKGVMDKIVALCKRRGFIYPGSEIYGGLANSWDFGPLGVELKNKIKQLWWRFFVSSQDDMVGIDGGIILNQKVWQASGHLENFTDPLIECKNCHSRFRLDQISGSCPNCGSTDLAEPKKFNLMFKTFIGPVENETAQVYLRPETAQAIFINFKNVLNSTGKKLPFGIAQIGKAFRNEITPSNFIFRTREFEQMEIEYFVEEPENDEQWLNYFNNWQNKITKWIEFLGINSSKITLFDVPEKERAHYSKKTIDFLYQFPFGNEELYGLAYRTNFDLKNHEQFTKENLKYRDPFTNKEFWPHVIEPSMGIERTILAILCEAFDDSNKERIVLHLKPYLAPYQAAVFPLLANKPELVNKAKDVYKILKNSTITTDNFLNVCFDDRGNIGKRYYSQDEIGTPYCITIDFQTLQDNTVTIRDRDTTSQIRIKIANLKNYLSEKIAKN